MSWTPREENPGRRPWAASTALLAAYSASAGATAIAVADGGTHRPGFALGLLALAAFTVALRATVLVALGAGGMTWLFYAGFITGRHAHLAWQGTADIKRLGILVGAALCGVALSWLHALASARRSAQAQPDPAQQSLVVVNLADARALRRRPR